MPFKPGRAKTGGRKVGVTNRFTGTFRDAVQVAYNDVGGHEAFTAWAKKNRTEFYRIAARLIPVEIRDTSDKTINVIINRGGIPLSSRPCRPSGIASGMRISTASNKCAASPAG